MATVTKVTKIPQVSHHVVPNTPVPSTPVLSTPVPQAMHLTFAQNLSFLAVFQNKSVAKLILSSQKTPIVAIFYPIW